MLYRIFCSSSITFCDYYAPQYNMDCNKEYRHQSHSPSSLWVSISHVIADTRYLAFILKVIKTYVITDTCHVVTITAVLAYPMSLMVPVMS